MGPPTVTVDKALLAVASLVGPWPKTEALKAAELWSEKPCVLYAVRRMG